MNKSKIAVIALLALLALSAAACLLSFAYSSLQDVSRQNRQEKLASYRAQEEEFQRAVAEYGDWKKLPDDLRAFRRDQLIGMDDFAVFRRELNLCLDDNGFRAANIAFQFGPSRNRMRRVGIRFSLSGPYRDIKKFIFDMERKPRMHFFERLDLNGGAEKIIGGFGMEVYLEE